MSMLNALLLVVLVCGAIVPGPCNFDPQREWDCSLAEPCPQDFACAADGYCKSADIACRDDEQQCPVPGLSHVGLCVKIDAMRVSKVHCGGCFNRCLGAGACEDGVCLDAPEVGSCVVARGNFDCGDADSCVADGDGASTGSCRGGARGDAAFGVACAADSTCDGALCEGGTCTQPCDFGCPRGTACDNSNDVLGGLCRSTGEEVCP